VLPRHSSAQAIDLPPFGSVGVGQSIRLTATFRFRLASFTLAGVANPVIAVLGVGHKPESVSSMGRIDGTSRDNGRPAGVSDAFQVNTHSVEPILANRSRNLFSHNDSGRSGSDKAEILWPEMALVFLAFAFAGDAERLTRTRAGPEFSLVRPASKSSCI
jgi:hypothetical protein